MKDGVTWSRDVGHGVEMGGGHGVDMGEMVDMGENWGHGWGRDGGHGKLQK